MFKINKEISLEPRNLTIREVEEINTKVESMDFEELVREVSSKTGYRIGEKSKESKECGFWNSGVKDSFSNEEIEEMKISGRMNNKEEILWFWSENDMKEILKDILACEKYKEINLL